MARIRTIKPEFWSDVKIARLSIPARLLFIAVLNLADDYGRGRYSPKEIAAFAFPEDEDIDARPLLQELIDAGRIHVFNQGDQRFFHVAHFDKHQVIKDKAKSRMPDPEGICECCAEIPRKPAENPPLEKGTGEPGNRGSGEAGEVAHACDDPADLPPPPVPGQPKGAGHPFSEEQLGRMKAALPPGQAISPKDMPGKIRQEIQKLVYEDKIPSDVLPAWVDLEPGLKVDYVIEGLRRAVLEDRAPVWRFPRAAEHIARALNAGVSLADDGWKPRKGSVTSITTAPSAPKPYVTAPWYTPWVLNAGARFERDGDLFQERLEIQYSRERAVDYDEAQRVHRRDGFAAAMDFLWANRLAKETG